MRGGDWVNCGCFSGSNQGDAARSVSLHFLVYYCRRNVAATHTAPSCPPTVNIPSSTDVYCNSFLFLNTQGQYTNKHKESAIPKPKLVSYPTTRVNCRSLRSPTCRQHADSISTSPLLATGAPLSPSPLIAMTSTMTSTMPTSSAADATASVPTATPRPKRGRRKKRPDLTESQRKALRAQQNRQATRRSRERSRKRAEMLKAQLIHSLRLNSLLVAERRKLLNADVKGNTMEAKGGNKEEGERKNPMSLETILNHDEGDVQQRARFRHRVSAARIAVDIPAPVPAATSKRYAEQGAVSFSSPVTATPNHR
ncbi:unnamed protein product [Chondrus crispus]|uniref:BZIP domain-containing protein n=1 Tax=Chondrus crispus TaxID=2769 RepID=R7QH41_CHOCR|nr:unnamed protein product [Chondrus crispus]CDF36786.1 unnamed protein product [Chondrus crispus]|eukprot:XP_005716605.1 unnamed protein product [Chondrus crispus]